jgi:hypothetical protein
VDGVNGKRAESACGGLLSSSVIDWGTGDVVRIRPTNGMGGLKILVCPHLVHIGALFEVLGVSWIT